MTSTRNLRRFTNRHLKYALVLLAPWLPGCACPGAVTSPKGVDPVVAIGFVTGLQGTVEPCGCTSNPLGGLDRMATTLNEVATQGPFVLNIVGNTFFEMEDPPGHLFEQEQRKADAIGEILAGFKPLAILPGPFDMAVHWQKVLSLTDKYKLPLMTPPRAKFPLRSRPTNVIRTVGGIRLGIIGIPGAAASEIESYSVAAAALRKDGAEIVIALLPEGGDAGKEIASHLKHVTVAVGGGADEVHNARMVGSVLYVEAGDKGQRLGVLRLHRPSQTVTPATDAGEQIEAKESTQDENMGWVFNDEGRGAKDSLNKRLDRMRKQVATMAAGPGKTAREAKIATLEKRLGEINVAPPTVPYVTWELIDVTKKVAQIPAVRDRLAVYNRSLCDIARRATKDRICDPTPTPADGYVGTEKCGTCHPDALAFWGKTKHAIAWKTLTDAGKECDLGCVSCHTVGYDKPGGFCRLDDAVAHANVGCENCHGPGAGHVKSPFDKSARSASFTRAPDASVCKQCHTPDHSDLFDFDEYRPKILGPGHGAPAR